jgi:PAS domain S-box-containing protein
MSSVSTTASPLEIANPHSLFEGGEMGALIQTLDWSKTPLGPIEGWPLALRMMVKFLLANRFPLLLWWGPQYIMLYNDPYRPVLGDKHPASVGQPAAECFSDIWNVIGPLIDTPFNGGPATWIEDLELEFYRTTFTEETHFTVAYSPVPDESAPRGIGGVLATVHEISEKVVGERRVKILRDLGTRSVEANTAEGACTVAARTLDAQGGKDLPFALFYLLEGRRVHLAASSGVPADHPVSPAVIDLDSSDAKGWPVREVIESESPVVVDHLPYRFADVPPGPWADPPHTAIAMPIRSNLAHQPVGVLILGSSARLLFDDRYRDFCELVTSQVAVAIASARALEDERKRVEALAELDRSKTIFFSNVSHEFRTPLTLMLGPLEDLLAGRDELDAHRRELLDVAHRNGLRLLKLVNTLLDFSRIEAGRMQATYQATDLAAMTADLASSFRAATEKAGLRFVVDCPVLPQPVYIDRDMWEKIVLNLISNAFKFTLEGEIRVTLRSSADGSGVALNVDDTGTGIPADELPRIFDRFHRVEGSLGRSHEGSGIGLALVQELVRLHAGAISVNSQINKGSSFLVSLPFGTAHLPKERLAQPSTPASGQQTTAPGPRVFMEEASRWLPPPGSLPAASQDSGLVPSVGTQSERVLIADDNADMRDYIRRLLIPHYAVSIAGDGLEALARAREEPPDLILSDVMMPRLDGLALLRELRADPATRTIPVILVSARAGEESRIEGIEAGADDYLTKPFTARELEARVKGALAVARIRRDSQEDADRRTAQFETLLNAAPLGVYLVDGDFRIREVNPAALPAFGNIPDLIGRDFDEVIHILRPAEYADEVAGQFRHTLETGEPYAVQERIVQRPDSGAREFYEWQINRIPLPRGGFGVVCYFRDISRQVLAREAIADSEARLRFMAESMPQKISTATPTGEVDYFNPQWTEYTGLAFERIAGWGWIQTIHPDDVEENVRLWKRSIETGEPFKVMRRIRRADGIFRWHLSRAHAMRDAEGKISMWIESSTEIHEQKEKEQQLQRANEDLQQFAYSASHDLQEPIRTLAVYSEVIARRYAGVLDPEGQQYLGFLSDSGGRLAMLVNDLLTYSQAGNIEGAPGKVDASAILQQTLSSLSDPILRNQATVTFDRLPEISMHEVHLQQIFQNLIGNALKYRGEEPPVVHVSAANDGGYWRFSVRDNGIGINPQYKDTVFGVFKRLHHDRKYSGTGIGLAICHRVVQRYGGRIWVESEIGQGATFFFTVRQQLE